MLEICEKKWIDIFSVLLTPTSTIAFFGTLIAYLQWQINQKRLKNELFNRRIELFDRISHYIADILCHGNVGQGEEAKFLRNTRNAFFIFDKDIEEYVDKIYSKSIKLQAFGNLQNSLVGDELINNLDNQRRIKDWFKEELNGIRLKFQKYLSL
jgi:hypothetical protein